VAAHRVAADRHARRMGRIVPRTDVTILRTFSPKKIRRKNRRFLFKTKLNYAKF
jgi:hypothetical protein